MIDALREKFEVALQPLGYGEPSAAPLLEIDPETGDYKHGDTNAMWCGFKLAIDSLAVELPDSLFEHIEYGPSIDGNSDVEISYIDISTKQKVSKYLESVGIKVVGK